MLLLDTNALVWWLTDEHRLGRRAASRIAAAGPGKLGASVLVWYELANLHGRKYLRFRDRLNDIRSVLIRDGLVEINLTGPIAADAAGLGGMTSDPFDRLIVATARIHGATLVTADASILAWPGELERLDARE